MREGKTGSDAFSKVGDIAYGGCRFLTSRLVSMDIGLCHGYLPWVSFSIFSM